MAGASRALCDISPAASQFSALSSASVRSAFSFQLRTLGKPCLSPPRSMILRLLCSAASDESSSVDVGRRQACVGMATLLAASAAMGALKTPEDAVAREVQVGSYLPVSEADPSFVQFKATSKDTPALRAGNVQPYEFVLPPTWKQERVANILSGNYCQPKCAEPWVEVKFADANQGAIQVVAAPMVRLTNKPNATIEEIGTPETILAALGPFVTGNSFDPEEVLGTSVQRRGDQTYYRYELETPYAKTGAHNLATATAKGSVVMLLVVSASDAQWSSSENLLRSIVDSFEV
ncbi:unnamed protein product [Calypogeia fissa]